MVHMGTHMYTYIKETFLSFFCLFLVLVFETKFLWALAVLELAL